MIESDNPHSVSFSPLEWRALAFCRRAAQPSRAPVLDASEIHRVLNDLDVWDAWPLADRSGAPVAWRGGELWFALAAPAFDDPEARHAHARIHHFHRTDRFEHIAATFPDGFSPGSREWSGSAILDGDEVTLYFTAAGYRDEDAISFQQRLFASTTRLSDDPETVFTDWSEPRELVKPDDIFYVSQHEGTGQIGEIKAFRDPFPWTDSDGSQYLLFTASAAQSRDRFNGVIGCALRGEDGAFTALAPLVDACGVNNELERPHIVEHGSQLYLFWSTQAKVFAPGITAPTGLYGAVAEQLKGPWRLLNGDGLVFATPENEPFQTYSWWVLPDLSVTSFVDYWGVDDPDAERKPAGRSHFGGTFAPFLHLRLTGDQARLET